MQTYIEKNKDKYKQYLSDYYKKDMNWIKKKLKKEVWRGIIRWKRRKRIKVKYIRK
jgi:hypothetical protein